MKRKADIRRQRKELSYQREQRPPEKAAAKPAASKSRQEVSKPSYQAKPVKTEAHATTHATTTTATASHGAAVNSDVKAAQSPPVASKHAAVAFGRTTHLPPPQPQRQTKSAPLHRVRAGSAENLNVSCF